MVNDSTEYSSILRELLVRVQYLALPCAAFVSAKRRRLESLLRKLLAPLFQCDLLEHHDISPSQAAVSDLVPQT